MIVELAPLRDPGLLLPTIASAIGVAEVPGQAPLDTLAGAVSNRELLLVLDNVEHLRSATPSLVELLARAPRLVLLVTSRAVLHLTGEHVFPVSPLDDDDAVELFEQRARALQPDFEVTAENEGVVREICRRVDGLPLAIELAAARTRSLTPSALLERLEQRLTVLTGGPHDLPARQQTLRETIDWSVGLLTDDERTTLARLSVFRAGATVEAAEAVCETRLDVLSTLIDHHLVRRTLAEGGSRLWLLETIHEYAAELLVADPSGRRPDACPSRGMVPRARGRSRAAPEPGSTDRVARPPRDRARQSAGSARPPRVRGRRSSSSALAVSLSRFWYVRGYLAEGRVRLEHALEATSDQTPEQRRRAFTAAASFGLLQGDHAAAIRFADEALAAAREDDDARFVANALSNLGAILLAAGDRERAGVDAGGGRRARTRRRGRTDCRPRDQQPRRLRADGRGLRTRRAALPGEPRAAPRARRHRERRALALQQRRGRPHAESRRCRRRAVPREPRALPHGGRPRGQCLVVARARGDEHRDRRTASAVRSCSGRPERS